MKKLTKAIATFCAMAMVVSVFSATVLADDEQNTEEPVAEAVAEEVQEAEIKEEENTEQEEVKKLPEVSPEELEQSKSSRSAIIEISEDDGLPVTSGSYKLVADINVTKTFQIEEDNATITLDLNGHKITYSGSGSMYIVGKVDGWNILAGNVTLTIDDSVGGGLITVADGYVGGGSTDHYISGSVGTDDNRGGCVLVQNSSTFILNNGTISGFHSGDEGGAVHCSNGSFFKMYGGKITNCSSNNGGAVSVHASSKGNTSSHGGKTYNIQGAAWIYGGEISGNTAIYLGGGVRVNRADLYLYGGIITGNTVTKGDGVNGGGGVQVLKPSANGQVQVLEIQGNVQIIGNHCDAEAKRANLFFNQNTTFTLVGSGLDPEARIAFGEATESTTTKFFVIDGKQYSEDNFICDNSGYFAYYNSSKDAIMMKTSTAPSILAYRVIVGGSTLLETKINLGDFDNGNTTVTYSYSYTKGTKTTDIEKTVATSSLTADGADRILTIPVESACMTAPITVTINYGTSGETTGDSVTIEQYAKYIINNSTKQTEKDVAEALLIYGGYAQVQFNINTDMLPSINDIDFVTSTASYGLGKAAYTEITDPDSAYAGAKLSMLSQTEIKMYFKKSVFENTAPEMTVSYSSDPIKATSSGSYYIYVIKGPSGNGFSASLYDQTFTYTVGNVSGTYSVETYLHVAKNSSTDQAMINLAEAYYNFAEKCQAL